jgi:hypothetical protein
MTSDPPVSAHASAEALHVLKLLTRCQRDAAGNGCPVTPQFVGELRLAKAKE